MNISVINETQPDVPGPEGDFIVQLPITSEEGRFMGLHAHGYPKFLASIDFEEEGDCMCCRVSVDGKHLITLEVEIVPAQQKSWSWYEYTVIDKHLLRTQFRHNG